MLSELTLVISASSRSEYRRLVTELFLAENPGADGDSSKYIYYVEQDRSGHRIYLKRPTNLNKGFDFEVRVTDTIFTHTSESGRVTRNNRPSHPNIVDDLILKKAEDPILFQRAKRIIDAVFNCEEVREEVFDEFPFQSGHPFDLIVKCIKWLFIEQDITYWNWSGRNMLYNGLREIWG
jgi:hypothetical protein